MMPTFDPIWDWLWPDSLYTHLRPLGEVGAGAVFLLLTVGLMVLAASVSGFGRQHRLVLGLAVSGTVLILALVPVGMALALLVAGVTVWTYQGVEKATPGQVWTIVLLRLGALAVAVMMVLRPSWPQSEDPRVPSVLIVVVDSSASMKHRDVAGGMSRWERALTILRSPPCADLLNRLRTEKNVQVVFYRAAEDVAVFDPTDRAGTADGRRTDIGQWLHALYQRHARDPHLRGVAIFSDGADNGTRYLAAEQADLWGRLPCGIYTFGLGERTAGNKETDLAFDPLSIVVDPDPVGVKQPLTARARLVVNGFQNPTVTLRLFLNDKPTDAVQTMQLTNSLPDATNVYEVQLTGTAPTKPGEVKVTLKVDKLEGEVSEANNEISTYTTVSKEGLSVLYVEGIYRFEARFVRDALRVRPSVRLYMAYRTRDEASTAETDLFQFDRQHYDVIIIGDISARRFAGGDPKVLEKVKQLVNKEGTGLLMLGGLEGLGKSDWNDFGKTIADILPVELTSGDVSENERVTVVPRREGLDHFLLQLDENRKRNKEIWKKVFEPLHGMNLLGKKRPGGLVLAVREESKQALEQGKDPKKKGQEDDEVQKVLVAGQYGKGRILVFAGDTTEPYWRMTPEAVKAHRRFWQQVVLWLAKQENQDDTVWVRPDKRRVAVTSPLGFNVGVRGKGDRKVQGIRYQVKVIGPQNSEFTVPTSHEPDKDERGLFDKTDVPGEYRIEVVARGKDGKRLGTRPATARFIVYEDDAEDRRQGAEPENLERISRKSDAVYKAASEANFTQFLEQIGKKRLAQEGSQGESWPDWKRNPPSRSLEDQAGTLWASGVLGFFLLFVTLVCLEWFLRRRWGMV
jgi:uncharacterized membrane protein